MQNMRKHLVSESSLVAQQKLAHMCLLSLVEEEGGRTHSFFLYQALSKKVKVNLEVKC